MSKLWKTTILLIGGVLAVCAFAAPTMALGPSWGPTNTPHLLTSTSLGLAAHVAGAGSRGVICTHAQMSSQVLQLTRLTITGAAFASCHATGFAAGCTATVQSAGLPWLATPSLTGNVRVLGVQLAIQFETQPGTARGCVPTSLTVTGDLGGGNWVGPQHQIDFLGDVGLTTHILGVSGAWVTTVTGTLRDATQTLTIN
jgi:hypothetical protein